MSDFSLIHPSWKNNINKSDYHVIEKKLILNNKLSDVWDCYTQTGINRSCNNHSVRFGLLITKCSNTVTYTNSLSFPRIDTSQVYFLNLRLLKGLFNVPVAFEIINVDPKLFTVELSYIENNKSSGKQTIQFFDNGDGHTRIVHLSYFKSNSPIRDALFYPLFHKKFIKEFHRSMKQNIQSRQLTVFNQPD